MAKLLNFQSWKAVSNQQDLQSCCEYVIFGCCIHNSRHLIIYDVDIPIDENQLNVIINYDFYTKQWTCKNVLTNFGLGKKGCVLKQSNCDGIWLETMGGLHRTADEYDQ